MGDRRTYERLRRATAAGVGSVFLLMAVGGCYTYTPVDPPGPPPGENVRVELTGAGQDELLEKEALDMEWLDGRLVDGAGDTVAVEVHLETRRMGSPAMEDVIDTLRVPRVGIRGMGVKTMSTSRTVLAGAVGVAALAIAYAAFGSGEGGQGGDDPPEQLIRLPLSRLVDGLARLLGAR